MLFRTFIAIEKIMLGFKASKDRLMFLLGSYVAVNFKSLSAAKSLQLYLTLCDPIDGSHQAPPSLGFSRQEHWSGLPFPSPMHESESEVAQSCPTLRDLMDCSPPGSSVHGTLKARVLEWGARAYLPFQNFRAFKIMLNLLCLCSINKIIRPE